MKTSLIVSMILALAATLQAGDIPKVESLTMRTLAKIGFSGLTEPQQVVIREEKTWRELWSKHAVDKETASKVPKIDFSKEMVIAVALGRQRSGGYLLEITRVEIEGEKLRITYRRKAPAPDSIVLQVVTTPVHFVAVPKSDLKAEFVEMKK